MTVFRALLPPAVSALCVTILVKVFWSRLPMVVHVVKGGNPAILALAFPVYLALVFVLALRIRLVFSTVGMEQSPFRFFLYTLIGLFFSNFLPTTMGGDVVKASYASGGKALTPEAFLATFIDRSVGLAGVILLGAASLYAFPISSIGNGIVWLPAGVVVSLVAVTIVARVDRWTCRFTSWLEVLPFAQRLQPARLFRAGVTVARSPRVMCSTLALTVVSQIFGSVALWLIARGLGIQVGLAPFLLAVPAMSIVSLAPSLNGLGIRDAALIVVLRGLLPEEHALSIAILYDAVSAGCSLLGGAAFVFRGPLGLQPNPDLASTIRVSSGSGDEAATGA